MLRKAGIITIIALLLLVVSAAAGQDILATNTPAGAVVELPPAAPVVQPSPSESNTLWVTLIFGVLVFGMVRDFLATRSTGALVKSIEGILNNKQLMEAAQQRYMESSLPVQEFIKLLHSGVGLVSAANIPGLDPLADKVDAALDTITTEPIPPLTTIMADSKE